MIRVGVAGLGMMGNTHLDVYSQLAGAEVVAVADVIESRRNGTTKVGGNIEGQAKGSFDITRVRQYEDALQLIEDPEVDLIDICLPTPIHKRYASAALEFGKHVLIEKPLALNASAAQALANQARTASGLTMCGMCMRFWPGWTWLKDVVDSQQYGRVVSASFKRLAEHPGGPFYSNAQQCGAAILDLHIHDTDFIHYLFGVPDSVTSYGLKKTTAGVDHVMTRYEYPNVPLVISEAGWSMAQGFGFQMQYQVNFELATACYDLSQDQPLSIFEEGKAPFKPSLPTEMGYFYEIEYFIDRIISRRPIERVTLDEAAQSIRIVEAEVESVRENRPVSLLQSAIAE